MKLRNSLMTIAFLLAVTASFASKTKSARYEGATYRMTPTSPSCILGVTEQDLCYDFNTGPVCTVYNIGNRTTAYSTSAIPCTVVLRQVD